jgi:signal transduction histidine kinase
MRDASSRASRIIGNVLRFSRSADAIFRPGVLAEILDESLELAANDYDLKKRFDFRTIDIVRDYQPDLPRVPLVTVEIEQVMLNLLKNAAQALIDSAPHRAPRIELRLKREERYAVLEVADNGPGMEESVRRRVFEPFFTTKEPGLGTGLGLSVSYMIVTQNHKGLMDVASAPGAGACFSVRLPFDRERSDA